MNICDEKLGNRKEVRIKFEFSWVPSLDLYFEDQHIHLLPSEIKHLKKILQKIEE